MSESSCHCSHTKYIYQCRCITLIGFVDDSVARHILNRRQHSHTVWWRRLILRRVKGEMASLASLSDPLRVSHLTSCHHFFIIFDSPLVSSCHPILSIYSEHPSKHSIHLGPRGGVANRNINRLLHTSHNPLETRSTTSYRAWNIRSVNNPTTTSTSPTRRSTASNLSLASWMDQLPPHSLLSQETEHTSHLRVNGIRESPNRPCPLRRGKTGRGVLHHWRRLEVDLEVDAVEEADELELQGTEEVIPLLTLPSSSIRQRRPSILRKRWRSCR